MRAELRSLLLRVTLGAVIALAIVGICGLFGLHLPLALLLAAGIGLAAAGWVIAHPPAQDPAPDPPPLDLEADFVLPHAQDLRVRRLEDILHGAQPSRRMTSRALGRVIEEIAEERSRNASAPPLSDELTAFITASRGPEATARTVGPLPRRTLHRFLRELAAGEERNR